MLSDRSMGHAYVTQSKGVRSCQRTISRLEHGSQSPASSNSVLVWGRIVPSTLPSSSILPCTHPSLHFFFTEALPILARDTDRILGDAVRYTDTSETHSMAPPVHPERLLYSTVLYSPQSLAAFPDVGGQRSHGSTAPGDATELLATRGRFQRVPRFLHAIQDTKRGHSRSRAPRHPTLVSHFRREGRREGIPRRTNRQTESNNNAAGRERDVNDGTIQY